MDGTEVETLIGENMREYYSWLLLRNIHSFFVAGYILHLWVRRSIVKLNRIQVHNTVTSTGPKSWTGLLDPQSSTLTHYSHASHRLAAFKLISVSLSENLVKCLRQFPGLLVLLLIFFLFVTGLSSKELLYFQ